MEVTTLSWKQRTIEEAAPFGTTKGDEAVPGSKELVRKLTKSLAKSRHRSSDDSD